MCCCRGQGRRCITRAARLLLTLLAFRANCPSPPPAPDLDLDAARPTDYDVRAFFLHRPRDQLYRRIDARVEEMVAGGLLTVGLQLGWVWLVVVVGGPAACGLRAMSLVGLVLGAAVRASCAPRIRSSSLRASS